MDDKIEKVIEKSWSNYSDLDYWIREMNQKTEYTPKWVLKMAMKHLRRDFYEIHQIACELKRD